MQWGQGERTASVMIPFPQKESESQYPISADLRFTSTSGWTPMPPTASPMTSIARRRFGMGPVAMPINRWASSSVYGEGNASLIIAAIRVLFACRAREQASSGVQLRSIEVGVRISMNGLPLCRKVIRIDGWLSILFGRFPEQRSVGRPLIGGLSSGG